MMEIKLMVNGNEERCQIEPRVTLADLLRHELGLTGTHLGCEQGVCGACTVLVNGISARSCLTLAVQVEGQDVTSIEGVARGEQLHPIQEAFRDTFAFQCGYCTPGFVMRVHELLRENPAPTGDEVREGLAGHICRCSGYDRIVEGVLLAAERMYDESDQEN